MDKEIKNITLNHEESALLKSTLEDYYEIMKDRLVKYDKNILESIMTKLDCKF